MAMHFTRIMKIDIYCDGASRGNPGKSSFGVIGLERGANADLAQFKIGALQPIFTLSESIGHATNNEAEYRGIISALKKCVELKIQTPIIYSDSELVVRQLTGVYKVKEAKMKGLFILAMELVKQVHPQFIHIRREKNQIADYLANQALDNA